MKKGRIVEHGVKLLKERQFSEMSKRKSIRSSNINMMHVSWHDVEAYIKNGDNCIVLDAKAGEYGYIGYDPTDLTEDKYAIDSILYESYYIDSYTEISYSTN